MQNAKDLAERALASQSESGSQTKADAAVCSDADVVAIWERMGSVYGHKWSSSYGERVDPTWRRALQSVPVERLKVALARCARRPDAWPPSLPEFMDLTRVQPDELGAPSFDDAWKQACNAAHPHAAWQRAKLNKAVYHAATRTGLSEIMERQGQRKIRAEFDENYQWALDRYDLLEEPPKGALSRGTTAERKARDEGAAAEWLPKIREQIETGDANTNAD